MYDRYLVLYVHTYARDDFRPKWKTSSRDESLVANCHAIAVVAVDGVTMHAVEMQPSLQESNYLFPYNPSLEDEIKRLFDISRQESQPKGESTFPALFARSRVGSRERTVLHWVFPSFLRLV